MEDVRLLIISWRSVSLVGRVGRHWRLCHLVSLNVNSRTCLQPRTISWGSGRSTRKELARQLRSTHPSESKEWLKVLKYFRNTCSSFHFHVKTATSDINATDLTHECLRLKILQIALNNYSKFQKCALHTLLPLELYATLLGRLLLKCHLLPQTLYRSNFGPLGISSVHLCIFVSL